MLNKKSIIKSVIYRVYSSSITFLLALLLTGNLLISFSIGLFDAMLKILSYYLFDEVWNMVTGFKAKPAVIWLTGLSASGKTTIAYSLIDKFKSKSVVPVLLDGDEIRDAIKQKDFDEDSRKKHNLNVGFISSLFERQGSVVIVSLISPYDDIRKEIRGMCKNFIEVYISTDIEVCIHRDPKGLYKKAISGELKNFTGISAPYYPPAKPEIIIDTFNISVTECSNKIFNFYKK